MNFSRHICCKLPSRYPFQPQDRSILVRMHNITKAFGRNIVLNGVTARICAGERILLRGGNGSGKTTLLNILTGNLAPDAGTISLLLNSGVHSFCFPRSSWKRLIPFDGFAAHRIARKGIGRTWQETRLFATQSLRSNIAVAIPNQTGENPAQVLFSLAAVRKREHQVINQADNALRDLGLQGRENSSGDRISLGQARRVSLARAIEAGVQVLFLDEPLAGLDEAGVAYVAEWLAGLGKDLTLVIVEHVLNAPVILNFATTVWTLENGQLQIQTPTQVQSEISAHPASHWARTLLAGSVSRTPENLNLPCDARISTPVRSALSSSEVLLEVRNVVIRRGNRVVLGRSSSDGHIQEVSLSLCRGEVTVLQAPNGWGKTTLLEAMAGLIRILSGDLRFGGRSIASLAPWERARLGISFLPANSMLFPSLTVAEIIRFSGTRAVPDSIQHLLTRKIAHLSGGERQRVAIACLPWERTSVLLLDEPFSALDSAGLETLQELIDTHPHIACLVAMPSWRGEGEI